MSEIELTNIIKEYLEDSFDGEYSEYSDWRHTDHENYIDTSREY